ncbi:MAG TPA: DMT family transporter [Neobacillus sp.]
MNNMLRSTYLCLVLLSMIWGGSYYFIKILLASFEPWSIVFIRSTLGLVTIIGMMYLMKQPFNLKKIPWIPMVIVAAINTAIPWGIIGLSETRIPSNMAAILNSTTPILSLILGILFFQAVSNRWHLFGMGVSCLGVVILLGYTPTVSSVNLLGSIGMIIASLFYALGSQLSKKLLHTLTPYQATFGTLLFTSLISGGITVSFEDINYSGLFSPYNLIIAICLGIFGSGIAYILFYFIVQRGGPELATKVTYLLPICSIIWGGLFLNEPVYLYMIFGLTIILFGIYLSGQNSKQINKMDVDTSS